VEILTSATSAASVVTTVLTAVLIVAVTVGVVVIVGMRLRDRRHERLVVTELTASGEMKGADFGAAVTETLKVRLEELKSEDIVRVDLATGPSGDLKLPADVSAQLPQAALVNAILSLIDMLWPPNEWRLKGHLEPPVDGQIAISLTLMGRGTDVTRAISLRESDFCVGADAAPDVVSARSIASVDYERYARLITPGAVWLYYQIRGLTGQADPPPSEQGEAPAVRIVAPAPFGVKNWQSYALTAAGAELQAADDADGARTLYARALGLEPKNRMALFNLGVLDMREGTRNPNESRLLRRGRLRFEKVIELSKNPQGAANACTAKGEAVHVKHDGLWCRATYNMALANILMGEDGDRGEASLAVSALMQRLVAIQTREETILDEDDDDTYRASMKTFADELEPQVLILAAGLLHLTDDANLRSSLATCVGAPPDDKLPAVMIDRARERGLNYRGHYNLAAYYARHGDREEEGSEGRTSCYRLALDELEACFEAATKDLKTWAQADPSFAGLRNYDDPAVKALFRAPQGAHEQHARSGSRA
jgi:tetratricopeptide (TPR) repeat protein